MDAYEALITRASPVELCDPAPDEATEQKIIAAALRAPDHGRLRPWHFISIRGAGRAFLGGVLASALSRRDSNATEDALQRERKKPLRAPLVLVVAARIVESSKIPAIEQMLSAGNSRDRADAFGRRCRAKHHACQPRFGLRSAMENG